MKQSSLKPNLKLLQLDNCSIYEQLQTEEALLRCGQENVCLINRGSPPHVVLGISGKAEELIDLEKAQQLSLPLLRRFSGGGTVVVDEETLFFSLILNEETAEIPSFPQTIMEYNSKLFAPLFSHLGFSLRENDYTLNGDKFAGNAQYICRNRWIQHTTFLWDYNPELMASLRLPTRRPAYRADRPHEQFLSRLKEHFSSKQQLIDSLIDRLRDFFTLCSITREEIEQTRQMPHRRSTRYLSPNPPAKSNSNVFAPQLL